MKILAAPTPPVRPTITSAVQFDPWPFKEDSIAMKDTFLLRDKGELADHSIGWFLTREYDIIVTFSDNTKAVARPIGLRNYR